MYFEEHLAIARERGDQRAEGDTLLNLGLTLDRLGDRAQAINHAQLALQIFDTIQHPKADKVQQHLVDWGAISK